MSGQGGASPRQFGLSVGGVLCLIAALLAWRGRFVRAEIAGTVGALLVLLGAAWPALLAGPARAWWRFATILGYVNTRILLTVLFAVLLTPLSLLWRLIGKDPLARRRDQFTGWSRYPERYRSRTHYERMY